MIRRLLALGLPLALSLLTASPAQAEVKAQSEAGFVVHHEAFVARPALEVWAELLAPARWWNKDHTWAKDAAGLYIDAQATGCFCELLPKDPALPEGTRRGSVEHMHVIHANPGKLLLMEGGLGPLQGEAVNAKLKIKLEGKEGGTLVSWDYVVGGYMRFKTEEIAPAVDQVLGEQLTRLAERLAAPAEPAAEKKPG